MGSRQKGEKTGAMLLLQEQHVHWQQQVVNMLLLAPPLPLLPQERKSLWMFAMLLLLVSGGGDDPRTTGEITEMKWSEGWDKDDVVPLVVREEKANSGNEDYEGKESKSTCSGGRSLNCGSPARNWATWRDAVHISPGARSVPLMAKNMKER